MNEIYARNDERCLIVVKLKVFTYQKTERVFEVRWLRKLREDAPVGVVTVTVPEGLETGPAYQIAELEALRFLLEDKSACGTSPTGWGVVIVSFNRHLVENMNNMAGKGAKLPFMAYMKSRYFHAMYEHDASVNSFMDREIESTDEITITDHPMLIVQSPKYGPIELTFNAVLRYNLHFAYGDVCKAPYKSVTKALVAEDLRDVDIYDGFHFKKIYMTLEECQLEYDLVVHRPSSSEYYVLTVPDQDGIRQCITMFFLKSKSARNKWKMEHGIESN